MTWLIQAESASNRELRGRRAPSPDPSGATRTYPDLKNVKTRLVLGPWSFFIGTFLELGTWSLELLLPTAQTQAYCAPMCTSVQSRAPSCGKTKNLQKCAQTAHNCTNKTPTVAAEVRRRIPFAPALAPVFLVLIGVVWCCLALFGPKKLLFVL